MERTQIIFGKDVELLRNDINNKKNEIANSEEYKEGSALAERIEKLWTKCPLRLLFSAFVSLLVAMGGVFFYKTNHLIFWICCLPMVATLVCACIWTSKVLKCYNSSLFEFKINQRNIYGWGLISSNLGLLKMWSEMPDFSRTYFITVNDLGTPEKGNERVELNIFASEDGRVVNRVTLFLRMEDKKLIKDLLKIPGALNLSFIDMEFLNNTVEYYTEPDDLLHE